MSVYKSPSKSTEKGTTTRIPARHGATLSGSADVTPQPLPEPPTDLRPLQGVVKARSQLTWIPAPSASKHRIQIASDVQFVRLASDRTVSGPFAAVPDIPPGQYYWHVFAVDADGQHSPPSVIHAFRVPEPKSQRKR